MECDVLSTPRMKKCMFFDACDMQLLPAFHHNDVIAFTCFHLSPFRTINRAGLQLKRNILKLRQ